MAKYETITLILSIIAILISLSSALYTGFLSEKLSSSDYKAKEQVKADTARLLSSLRSMMHKGALSSTTKDEIDISYEKNAISEFLTSQTGLAYYAWVDEKSSEADAKGRTGELWRVFFLYLAELSNASHPYSAARRAADVEILFDQLTEEDISKISEFNSDLIKAIANNSKNRDGNVVVNAFFSSQKEVEEERSSENLSKKLRYLKSIGIDDPNIDLFLAVMGGDDNVDAAKAALEAGADVNMTDGALLEKYKKELENYDPASSR